MEQKPKSSPLSLPLEQYDKLPPEELASVAKSAGVSVDKFRELINRAVDRKKTEQAKQKEAPKRAEAMPDKASLLIRDAIKEGLRDVYKDNESRDPKEAEEYEARADKMIKEATELFESRQKTWSKLSGMRVSARNLYTKAYKIRVLCEMDSLIKAGSLYEDARAKVTKEFSEKANTMNLDEEKEGIQDALRALFPYSTRENEEGREMRALYETLVAGGKLSEEQNLFLQKLIRQAKGAIFKSGSYGGDIEIIARALKKADIWKTDAGGTSGSVERFDIGSPATSSYYKGSRPRRDMYGSSGGQDDK